MRLRVVVVAACAVAFAAAGRAQDSRAVTSRHAPPGALFARAASGARLVVVVVVDQLGTDVLRSAWPHMVENGFHRLARGGVSYPLAEYDHACTETGPGHATIATGASPSLHGILANDWPDPATGTTTSCVDDAATHLLGAGTDTRPGASARQLRAPTLGDTMKLAFGRQAHVVSLSIKARSAILSAGASADLAAWFDVATGNMVTSTAFAADEPAFLRAFNSAHHADSFSGWTWTRTGSATAYESLNADDDPSERAFWTGAAFPHVLPDTTTAVSAAAASRPRNTRAPRPYEALTESPAGNTLLMRAAEAAIAHYDLGADDIPDLLVVSFSSNDLVGHAFGPSSHESRDITLRTDQDLAHLLVVLDARVGVGRYTVLLSADHGITPAPEVTVRQGVRAGRLDDRAVRGHIEAALIAANGAPPAGQHWVAGIVDDKVVLNHGLLVTNGDDTRLTAALTIARHAITTMPGVLEVWTAGEIGRRALPDDDFHHALLRSAPPGRTPDLWVIPTPYTLFSLKPASHGAAYTCDRRVPLMLFGAGIRAGFTSLATAAPGSGVVTIAETLGIVGPIMADHPVLVDALVQ